MFPGSFSCTEPPPLPHEQPRHLVDRARLNDHSRREAGAHLLRMMIDLYSCCRLTAAQFCQLCWLADQAGTPGGAFSTYAQREGLQSGRYQQFLDTVLPQNGNLADVKIPMNQNRAAQRTIRHVPSHLVCESLDEECAEDASIFTKLDAGLDATPVLSTRVYREHPVVQKAIQDGERLPVPLAVYVDGVRYRQQAAGRSDSVAGYWISNLVSGRRHLVAVVRHSDECACGCKGWCSTFPVLHFIRWQLLAMQHHARPALNYDGTELPEGCKLGRLNFSAVLVYVKGDWLEHAKTMGLSSWSQHHGCCQFCKLVATDVHSLAGDFDLQSGWPAPLRTHNEYFEDARKCEKIVQIDTQEDLQKLIPAVGLIKKGKAAHGIGVCVETITINGAVLLRGDRLEPSESLLDTHSLRSVRLPVTLVFWRTRFGNDTKLPLDSMHHRCPLFDERLHSSPVNSLAIDELHTLHLGEVQRVVSAGLWRVVLNNPWGFKGTNKSIIDQGIRMLWTELKTYQKRWKPTEQFQNLTKKMLGKRLGADIQDCSFLELMSSSFKLHAC